MTVLTRPKAGEGAPHPLPGGGRPVYGSTPMRALAAAILAQGLDALPRADHECFTLTDWQSAAQYAVDSGDHSELSWMLLRDRAYNEFEEWRTADFERREDADFGNFVAQKARWNVPNWFEGALTPDERRGL